MGRVLPLFLAILFIGGTEQQLHAVPDLSAGAQPRTGRAAREATPGTKRLNFATARTVLCLLPALLTHAYQADSGQAFTDGSLNRRSGAELSAASRLYPASAAPRIRCVFAVAELWQRPPPAV